MERDLLRLQRRIDEVTPQAVGLRKTVVERELLSLRERYRVLHEK